MIDDTGTITMECTTVPPDVTDANDLMIQNINNIKAAESKNMSELFETHREKTSIQGFRPGPIQTGLYSHRR